MSKLFSNISSATPWQKVSMGLGAVPLLAIKVTALVYGNGLFKGRTQSYGSPPGWCSLNVVFFLLTLLWFLGMFISSLRLDPDVLLVVQVWSLMLTVLFIVYIINSAKQHHTRSNGPMRTLGIMLVFALLLASSAYYTQAPNNSDGESKYVSVGISSCFAPILAWVIYHIIVHGLHGQAQGYGERKKKRIRPTSETGEETTQDAFLQAVENEEENI